ncbi:MAG: DNA translocase FtsK 4TM domain-containing protein [Bacilli bacterium]|nr:DNA translocase FtsK 4TM domain-containing protein [Bacilli bacterium]MBQ8872227.1 DNA translocase FtsK 4TM domain-containing protein [Bacilli bacterium]
MAKKKKRKAEKETSPVSYELKGFIVILVALIGLAKFGPVGDFVKGIGAFLVGQWYAIFYILVAIIGIYMVVKGEKPKFFTSKLIGLYILILAVLVLSHLDYAEFKGFEMITKTFDNLCAYFESPDTINLNGGGILGAIFCAISIALFAKEGATVISWILVVAGIILFTGLSIKDIVTGIKAKIKIKGKVKESDRIAITKAEDDYEADDKVVITSMEELTKYGEKKEEKEIVVDPETGEVKEEEEISKVYYYPPITLLNKPAKSNSNENNDAVKTTAPLIENVLKEFEIESKVVAAHVGPSVTQYELEVKTGTKLNRILAINRELALALAAKEVRIQAPIPGKSTVGIELPNKKNTMVSVREVLERIPSSMKESKLAVTLGRDIMGNPQYCEINKTPHLLVAGSTGSGKSVCINSIIVSILMRTRPDEVKLVLVDPKKVELSMYNGVPHLLAPVVTDPRKANIALKKMVTEMERRYDLFENSKTKNIAGYNTYIDKQNEKLPEGEKLNKLPFIVIIIDELADLMLVAAKEVQDSIMRITQMARAAGIHLIVATQRPSTDVITGVVKANIPSRIAFAVSSGIDSRTILDSVGAEKLLGKGDMLFLPQGENTPIRIQGTFVSDDEIKNVVNYTIKQQKARYDETLTMDPEEMNATTMVDNEGHDYDPGEDPLYDQVVEFVVTSKKASTSLIQRRFRIGYNRAANLVDKLEERGIVGPQNGSKPREVLVELQKED